MRIPNSPRWLEPVIWSLIGAVVASSFAALLATAQQVANMTRKIDGLSRSIEEGRKETNEAIGRLDAMSQELDRKANEIKE